MRRTGLTLAALAFSTVSALWGCGGSGGSTALTGVWSGAQTRADDGTIEYEFTLNGTAVTGTARITTASAPPAIYTGTFTGTFVGNAIDVTVTWTDPAGYGTTHFTGTQDNNHLSGTYTHTPPGGAPETGNVTLVKSSVTTPVFLTGTFNGTAHDVKTNIDSTLTEVLTQNGNAFSGSITVIDINGTQNGTLTGTIIGNHITEGNVSLSGLTYSFNATVAGQAISGTWFRVENPDHNGTFALAKAQSR